MEVKSSSFDDKKPKKKKEIRRFYEISVRRYFFYLYKKGDFNVPPAPETSYWLIEPAKSDRGMAGPFIGFDVPG